MHANFWRAIKGLFMSLLLWLGTYTPAQAQQLAWIQGAQTLDSGVNSTRHWVDINNDGRDDFCSFSGSGYVNLNCYLVTSKGISQTKLTYTLPAVNASDYRYQWVDINGDGLKDFCRGTYSFSSGALFVDPGGFYNADDEWIINCHLGLVNGGIGSAIRIPIRMAKLTSVDLYNGNPGYVRPGLWSVKNTTEPIFADVNADGRTDICYFYTTDMTSGSLECRLSNGSGFDAPQTAWRTSTTVQVGDNRWTRGFYDFNGDGYPDYCRVLAGDYASCLINTGSGFAGAAEVTSARISNWGPTDASAFLDVNRDGNIDFCGIAKNAVGVQTLGCLVSNGRSWEPTVQYGATLGALDPGWAGHRWWTDVNGDGYPDFCRAVRVQPGGGKDVVSDMACRLGQAGTGASDANKGPFVAMDIIVPNVNFGQGDGGRQFCDPFGTGLQTLCRSTYSVITTGQTCYTDLYNGIEYCTPITSNVLGLQVGLSSAAQAAQPLMTSVSDGLGAETRLSYLNMTDSRVYTRSSFGTWPRQLITMSPSPLVYETRAWQRIAGAVEATWPPLTGSARYYYKDMMTDTINGGRGFRERYMFTEGSNTLDRAVYFQGRGPSVDATSRLDDPLEIGQAKLREKYLITSALVPDTSPGNPRQQKLDGIMSATALLSANPLTYWGAPRPILQASPFVKFQSTTNSLGDTATAPGEVLPAGTAAVNPRIRFVRSSVTNAWDVNGTAPYELPTSSTTTEMNPFGNVWSQIQTTTQTGTPQGTLTWSKTTTSEYFADDVAPGKWILGRLKKSTVTSTAPTEDVQLSLNASSAGSGPTASATAGTQPAVPQPLAPATLSAILGLLLDD